MSAATASRGETATTRMGLRWLAAFSILILAVHEAHELAHTVTGRLMCGEWATRDFNEWSLSAGCTTPAPTAAGPLFSYLVIAIGIVLTRRGEWNGRWMGLALIFAANPLARIITVGMRGGDELVVARALSGGQTISPAVYWTTMAAVTLICGAGIVAGWAATRGIRWRGATFAAILLLPMVLTGTLLFVLFNGLLRDGFLAQPIVAGSPVFITIVTGIVGVLLVTTAGWLRNPSPARVA
jgi:hypothetical protein